MNFDEAYRLFIEDHASRRRADRLQALRKLHGHSEEVFLKNVWWGMFGNFNGLHPQYEVYDFRDGRRYLDFAYIGKFYKVAIEIDDFGSHGKHASAMKFSDDRMRQNHLVLDRWEVVRFSYHHITQQPRACQQVLQQLIGVLSGFNREKLSVVDQEVIRFGLQHDGVINFGRLCAHLGQSAKTTRMRLEGLMRKELMIPLGGPQRIHNYKLVYENLHKFKVV